MVGYFVAASSNQESRVSSDISSMFTVLSGTETETSSAVTDKDDEIEMSKES